MAKPQSGKKSTPDTNPIDAVARKVLSSILVTSIERKREYGGMIYSLRGAYLATEPVTSDEAARVDVGLSKPNHGCPDGATPVAFYHTHPTYSVAGMKGDYSTFSSDDDDDDTNDDIGLARSNRLDAYLGTLDGSFLKYDHKTQQILRLGRLPNASVTLK